MRAINRCLGLLAASLMQASCGGGGGSGGDGAFQPTPSGTITITATTTTLPLNRDGVGPFFGSPYMAELDITWRRANGDLVTGQEVAVAISPVSVAGFSTLDDPETQIQLGANGQYIRGNEFLDILGSGPVDVTAGHAKIFVHSDNIAGTAIVTVTARDSQSSNTTISKTFAINVLTSAPPLPASVLMNSSPAHIYLGDTSGPSSSIFSAVVRDGSGQLIPNPAQGNTGFNNIQFDIVGGDTHGNLTGISATGPVAGSSIKSRTIQGVASVSFNPGTVQGPIQVRATVDRADNNVDNGITQPLSTISTVSVSDGKLFSIALTSPVANAIIVNRVLNTPVPEEAGELPPAPNGTYALIVSALATDRQGNPVPRGTVVRFGAIDSPLVGFPDQGSGSFLIGGNDGNPQESGTLFTSLTGCFTGFIKPTSPRCSSTGPGERPGPGDTLLTFGDLVLGNRDLESARTISNINTSTSLNVSVPFNRNDDSGTSIDSGPVIPYVIGRAQDAAIRDQGNIDLPNLPDVGTLGITDDDGVASAVLSYPVAKLGKSVYVWAQGDGVAVNGGLKKVTDIAGYVFPGVAPADLTVNPEQIPGNVTAFVTVCIVDAYGAGLQGIPVSYAFTNLPTGAVGSVDGNGPSGLTDRTTGAGGCLTAQVTTTGIGSDAGGDGPQVVFSAVGDSEPVDITTGGGSRTLTAAPSAFRGGGGTVTLSLRDASGNPIPGVLITGVCEGAAGIGTQPGVTNAQGQTTSTIIDNGLNGYGSAEEATCTFTAATGEETTVQLTGIDFCEIPASGSPPPDPELCGDNVEQVALTVSVTPVASTTAPTCSLTVVSNPPGITCTAPAGSAAITCSADFDDGESVTLTAAPAGASCPAPTGRTINFSGGCARSSSNQATVALNSPQTCNVSITIP